MRTTARILVASLALAALVTPVTAAPVTINGITASDLNIFRDNRSVNDVGVASGDRFQFGLNISGGSSGYTGGGIFVPGPSSTASPLTQALANCGPTTSDPSQCDRSAAFDAGKLNGTWSFEIQSPSGKTATFLLPSAAPIPLVAVAFPHSVTITNSANGVNPMISWTLPNGYVPDAFRINIYDRSTPLLPNGTNDIIHSAIISPNATSYTVPAILRTGKSLIVGYKYSFQFELITTRDGGPDTTNSNADILTRSSSWFDFTPQMGSTVPTNINLPMVSGTTGVYYFNIGNVGPSSVTYIDPTIAVGYEYATGAGDPNFASVILPDVGGGVFDLSYGANSVTLDAGIQYFFPTGGVADFTVTGIDPAAELDPTDTSAFVTGLTFVANGSFTGTMTPLTVDVTATPEPASLALLAAGLFGCAFVHRRNPAPATPLER